MPKYQSSQESRGFDRDRFDRRDSEKQPKGGSIVWEPASTEDELSASNSPATGQIHN